MYVHAHNIYVDMYDCVDFADTLFAQINNKSVLNINLALKIKNSCGLQVI